MGTIPMASNSDPPNSRSTGNAGSRRRASGSRRTATSAADTRQVILAAAEKVLIRVGYANFTTRKVAAAAGIAVGNLTYHFPNKVELTEALIDYILDRYIDQIRNPTSATPDDARSANPLAKLVRWTINDAVTPPIGRICRELWAMACHQKFAARAMDGFYMKVTQAAAQLAQTAYPTMTDDEAAHLTYFMAILSEGAVVLFGTNPNAHKLLPGVIELAVRAIEHLAAPAISTAERAKQGRFSGKHKQPRAAKPRMANRPNL
jgi:AcrR family transcriptional regulator